MAEPQHQETVFAKAARLDSNGTELFHAAVVEIAIGITNLSVAEQDKAENGTTEDGEKLKDAGLQAIAQGTQDIQKGKEMVAIANTIGARQASLKSVGRSSSFKHHNLSFDQNRISEEGQRALEEMEQEAGVPAASLIAAVNQGGTENVVEIAAGAKGVQMSEAQIMAIIPNYGTSEKSIASVPSAPVKTGIGELSSLLKRLDGAHSSNVALLKSPEERKISSASVAPAARPEGGMNGSKAEEGIVSLGTDQLMGSLLGSSASSSEEENTLFHRVKRQYDKRSRELAQGRTQSSAY